MGKTSDWLVPAGLLLLCFVPIAAGTVRLSELAAGIETAENARFFAAPLPVLLHVPAVTLFGILGALQFAPALRRRFPLWHRWAGRLVVPAGLLAALSGLWMDQFYALPAKDGFVLYLMRLASGAWMSAALVTGYLAIRRRDVAAHQDWMLRGYAVGMGAGTQVLTGLPYFLLVGQPGVAVNAVLMGAGWGINVILAEWIIARRNGHRPILSTA